MNFSKQKYATMTMDKAKQALDNDFSIVLIDVRSAEEYAGGHIPQSLNVPLDQANAIAQAAPDKSARLFVYCLSGARSRSACGAFAKLGYSDVTNIGGINSWTGETERG